VTVDLPGHGDSPPGHDRADLWQAASLVGEAVGPAVYVGYSLGARVALHLALAQPDMVQGIVLVGARMGFPDNSTAAERRASDDRRAADIESHGVERFLQSWLAESFNARLSDDALHTSERLRNRADGLAGSLRHTGLGSQEYLWGRLKELRTSVLLIVGEDDLPGVAEENRKMAAVIGDNASFVVVPGSGHSVPFEKPDLFVDVMREFLADVR